jgi:ATP diphosphatase
VRIGQEIGDLLFAAAQLARHYGVNPETALREANARFERRFGHVERALAANGRTPADTGIDELEALWHNAKKAEG